jgi:hypothetical protein
MKWGDWTYTAENLTLVPGAIPTWYLDLERCTTSAAALDWIFQAAIHGLDMEGLIAGLRALINPQATFCSGSMYGGRGKNLDATKRLERLEVCAFAEEQTKRIHQMLKVKRLETRPSKG